MRRDLSKVVCEKEFREFIGEPLTRTRKEIREYFNLDHDTLKSLLNKYDLTQHTLTPQRRYATLPKYLKENPGVTYNKLAEIYGVTYKNIYNAVASRELQHLVGRETQEQIQQKVEDTMLKRYGVTNPSHHPEINARRQQTVVDRYGVKHIGESKEVQQKIENTFKERYGVKNMAHIPGVQEKREVTTLKRYGVENVMQLPEFNEKRIQTNLKRYGAKNKPPTEEQIQKRRETMLKRYNKSNLMKTPEAVLKARKTLLNNEYRESRGWHTINEANIHLILSVEAFEKEMETYTKKPTILEFIEEKELPIRTVYNFIQTHDLYHWFDVRWGTSHPEKEIKDYLIELGVEAQDIICNDRTVLTPYEIDLYLPKYNVGVEFNGTYYHSTLMSDDKNRHQRKALMAQDKGIILYQIFEFDWDKARKRNIIKSQLRNLLHKNSSKIYARDTEIREVDNATTKEFMEHNHMQGDGNLNKQVNLGLYHNNELVYMMTFGKWRRGFKGILDYEIFRSCSKLNTTVVGGASKLFKHFLKMFPNVTIGTYSNLQTGDGNLYKMLGFKFNYVTRPTSFKVNRRGEVFTLFSKEYQENRRDTEFYYEIYNTGSKLWIYNDGE